MKQDCLDYPVRHFTKQECLDYQVNLTPNNDTSIGLDYLNDWTTKHNERRLDRCKTQTRDWFNNYFPRFYNRYEYFGTFNFDASSATLKVKLNTLLHYILLIPSQLHEQDIILEEMEQIRLMLHQMLLLTLSLF